MTNSLELGLLVATCSRTVTAYPSSDAGTKEIIKDVTAFASADGGYLIIGIAEDGEHRASRIVNVEDTESMVNGKRNE